MAKNPTSIGRPRKLQSVAPVTQAVSQTLHPQPAHGVEAASPGLLRLERIIKGNPAQGVEPLVPVSRTTLYELIKTGQFPAPVRLPGVRASFWRSADVMAFIAAAGGAQ